MSKIILFFIIAMVCSTANASEPKYSAYIEAKNNNTALILLHGKGKHPTWLVVEPLRKGVHRQLNYHTLSLQMPTGHAFWEDYADDFPEAYAMINEAIRFLRDEKGVTRIFLMGHSMGSRMASAYAAQETQYSLAGLIITGCRNNGLPPLSCDNNLKNITIPVLDIWGNGSSKDSAAAYERENLLSAQYQQININHSGHRFEGYEKQLIRAVVTWLRNTK